MARRSGITIQGLQEAQERNLRRIAMLQPRNAPGRAVKWAGGEAHRWLTYYTPWQTGALRAGRRISLNLAVPRAQIFTSRNAYNPRSDTRPAEYDYYLHQRGFIPGLRGGIQASFPYTVWRRGRDIARHGVRLIARDLQGVR